MQTDSIMARRVVDVVCISLEKRTCPTSHYVYILSVSWSDGVKHPIYRKFSSFFDFLALIKEEFKDILKSRTDIILPELPTISFFGRNWVGKETANKRATMIEEFCKKIIELPEDISSRISVTSFFETWDSDFCQIEFDKLNKNQNRFSWSAKFSKFLDDHQLLKKFNKSRSTENLKVPATSDSAPDIADQESYYTKLTVCSSGDNKSVNIDASLTLSQYMATANFSKTRYNEADLLIGDRVTVIEKHLSGWWLIICEKTGEQGWAPGNYLVPADQQDVDNVEVEKKNKSPLGSFETLCDYEAQSESEISYKRGQTVVVLSTTFDGWFQVKIDDKVGFIPADHVRNLHRKPSNSAVHQDLLQFMNSSFKEPRKYWKPTPPRRTSMISMASNDSLDTEAKTSDKTNENAAESSQNGSIDSADIVSTKVDICTELGLSSLSLSDSAAEENIYMVLGDQSDTGTDLCSKRDSLLETCISEEGSEDGSMPIHEKFSCGLNKSDSSLYSKVKYTGAEKALTKRKYSFSEVSYICETSLPDNFIDDKEDEEDAEENLPMPIVRRRSLSIPSTEGNEVVNYTEVQFSTKLTSRNSTEVIGDWSTTTYSQVRNIPVEEVPKILLSSSPPTLPPKSPILPPRSPDVLSAACKKPIPAPRNSVRPKLTSSPHVEEEDDPLLPPPVPPKCKKHNTGLEMNTASVSTVLPIRKELNRSNSMRETANTKVYTHPSSRNPAPSSYHKFFGHERQTLKDLSRQARPRIKTAVVPPLMNLTPAGFSSYPWYHGRLAGKDSLALFSRHSNEHDFLVRERRNGNGYALSVLHEGEVRHFPIDVQGDGTYLFGKTYFRTLNDVVEFYMLNPLSKDQSWVNANFNLKNPVPKRK
ncbi:uncharacterized protein LOC141899697 isoform X2 [Tubulanus polymorphus]